MVLKVKVNALDTPKIVATMCWSTYPAHRSADMISVPLMTHGMLDARCCNTGDKQMKAADAYVQPSLLSLRFKADWDQVLTHLTAVDSFTAVQRTLA